MAPSFVATAYRYSPVEQNVVWDTPNVADNTTRPHSWLHPPPGVIHAVHSALVSIEAPPLLRDCLFVCPSSARSVLLLILRLSSPSPPETL
jgi:hypothetical protein